MSTPVLTLHADEARWVDAAVTAIVAGLQADLETQGDARLLVSGGGTPAPVYRALSRQSLDWSRISIRLVDERWLPVDDADSNARLVRDTLLQHRAAEASFEPMLMPGRNFDDSVAQANLLSAQASVMVLGMGADGHTASLFPHMQGLDAALASSQDYVGVDATGCPGAQAWPRRISLAPAGLARPLQRMLLVRGEAKLQLLQRALAGGDLRELPVRAAFAPGAPLHVLGCLQA
jgi:6-phosphogluconolactonase